MKIYDMYKEMEGKVIHFANGCFHPTVVADVGNSTPIDIVIEDGYAKYKGEPMQLTKRGWESIYSEYLRTIQ